MPKNIGDNRVNMDGIARISQEDAERLKRHRVKPGDIVYSRRGDVEKCVLIREQERGWLCGTGCMRIRFGSISIDPAFAFYYLSHPNVRKWIVQHAIGATMPNLNNSILSAIPFVLPSLKKQQTIAHILGSFDDKIDLNRRMNHTLEEATRTLFKSWFVDFDPVRAKIDGREGRLPEEIMGLFPEAFEDSALGKIPRGWEVNQLGKVVNIFGGGTPDTKNPLYWDGGTHYFVTPKDLSSLSSPILTETERKVTDAGLAKISSGLLPPGTLLLSSRAPIGYLAISQIPVCVNQGFIAMICDGSLSNYYMLNWTKVNMAEIEGRAGGTTFPEISKSNFRPIPILVPQQEIILSFDQSVEPLYTKIAKNLVEIRTLTILRNSLLPKLMSGEIEFNETEMFHWESL